MVRLNLEIKSKGRPSKKTKCNKFFKVYCTEKEFVEFQEYCNNLGIPVSTWFGEKMRKILKDGEG